MPTSSFAVPTIFTTATLHFAEVSEDATAQDVIDALIETARAEVLGGLDDQGWALQKIRVERNGRPWEEDELEALGDGTLYPSILVAPLVNAPPTKATTQRHFSSFPMTVHLHNPVLRLVSLHPHLSIHLSFLRVPEIHDDFRYKVFISKTTTIHDVINAVIDELGLTKSLPVPGGGNLEYVLEEVWKDADSEKSTRLPGSSLVFSIIESSFCANPYTSAATRGFRFCVPDEWYRRSKSRSVSTASTEPTQSTIRRLAALQEFDEDEEDEGTAKMSSPESSSLASAATGAGTISQNRLSTLFDGWFQASPPSRSSVIATSEKRKSIVSEPILVENQTGNSSITSSSSGQESDFDEGEFEDLVNNLGLKNDKRTEMLTMSPERKRTILSQHKLMKAGTTGSVRGPAHVQSYGPSSAAGIMPRIVPQLTGDGLMKRFSIWGAAPAAPPVVSEESHTSGEFDKGRKGSIDKIAEEPKPVLPQSTGGRWSSWWSLSSGDRSGVGDSRALENSPKWYVDGLKSWKTTDIKLLKHIISLRVHLRNASMAWVEEFLSNEKGLDSLTAMLAGLVGKGGKRKNLTEIETNCLLEIVKCFKVFLNAGNDKSNALFDRIIAAPMVVTYITYSLHVPSPELRTMSSEILAALSFLSADGHKAALSALSDYRVTYDEMFRFEGLVNSLQLPSGEGEFSDDVTSYLMDMDDEEVKRIWNPRAAVMSLVNALTNCPDALEDRIVLREEFSRRGLNEVIVALRYVKPPEYVMNQLNVYTEEKLDDDAEMRERARGMMRRTASDAALSDAEDVLQDIVRLAQEHGELYPVMVDILHNYNDILGKDVELQLKADLLTVLDKFVEQAAMLDKFDDSWHIFMKRFVASVSHITGQELEVKAASESDHIVEEELESLRTKVEELSDERTKLKNELNQQIAEMNALKSLPLGGSQGKPPGKGGPESFHGVVQRLVQKEKQVLQLQSELDRIKGQQHPNEVRDADERAKQARDRTKWNTLMDEIAKLKVKNSEAEDITRNQG
ncbi:armadillo-type protein [Armillaria mellea]|nr:armadillo-type protein [Armillaria mellea]